MRVVECISTLVLNEAARAQPEISPQSKEIVLATSNNMTSIISGAVEDWAKAKYQLRLEALQGKSQNGYALLVSSIWTPDLFAQEDIDDLISRDPMKRSVQDIVGMSNISKKRKRGGKDPSQAGSSTEQYYGDGQQKKSNYNKNKKFKKGDGQKSKNKDQNQSFRGGRGGGKGKNFRRGGKGGGRGSHVKKEPGTAHSNAPSGGKE